jgi:membrane protein
MSRLRRARGAGREAERVLNRVRVSKRLGLADLVKRTVEATAEDHLAAFAGSLTYHGLFAIFPFLLFLLSLLALFEVRHLVDALLYRAQTTLPPPAFLLLQEQIVPLARMHADATLAAGALFSLVLALWGISGAFRAVMDAMNVMYGVPETRPLWQVYALSLGLSLVGIALFLLSLALVVFGAQLAEGVVEWLGQWAGADLLWLLFEWSAVLCFNLLVFAVIYHAAPNLRRRFRLVTPGALLAQALWLAFSLLFSLYVNEVDWFNATYGTLAGLVILLLYMYYSAYILLLGAEINRVLDDDAAGPV